MATTYELWDLDTRSLLAVFDSEEAALAAIRADLRAHRPRRGREPAAGPRRGGGGGGGVAAREELIARAQAATAGAA